MVETMNPQMAEGEAGTRVSGKLYVSFFATAIVFIYKIDVGTKLSWLRGCSM
jgi:hypothetical protein